MIKASKPVHINNFNDKNKSSWKISLYYLEDLKLLSIHKTTITKETKAEVVTLGLKETKTKPE